MVNIGYIELTKPIEDFTALVKSLKQYADSPEVDCIIIHINSPGGYPGNSQIIADFIGWVKQVKPVIAFISDSGTSGAYWVAAACSYIIAPETAHIGSIGVVSELPKKNKTISFTAGKFKRVTYLADGLITPEDSDAIQSRLNKTYDIFCRQIAELRNIPVQTVKGFEAQVYLGQEALEHGLIEQTGTIQDVFNKAVELTSTKRNAAPSLLRLIISPTEVFEFAL